MGEPTDRRESLCRSILPSSPIECKMETTVSIWISGYFKSSLFGLLVFIYLFILVCFFVFPCRDRGAKGVLLCTWHWFSSHFILKWPLPCLPEKEKCQEEMYSGFDSLEQWDLNANGSTMLHLPVQFYFHSGCCCHIHIRGQKEIVFY